jgi:hypothetical protein
MCKAPSILVFSFKAIKITDTDYVSDHVNFAKSITPSQEFLSEEPFTDDLEKTQQGMTQIYGAEMGKEILAMEMAMQNRYL